MSHDQVQFGLIGCGAIVRDMHLPALAKCRRSRAVALCDVDQNRLEELAGRSGIDRLYGDYREMLADPEVHAVVVALPPGLNREIVTCAAEGGKHVLVEKPIADSLEDAEAIIDACRRHGVKLCVNHQRRFSECDRKAAELIRSGAIGDLVHIRIAIFADALEWYREDSTWQFAPGGGVWVNWAVHLSDLLRFLTNDEVDRIYAEGGSVLRDPAKGPESFFALMRTRKGVVAELQVSAVRRRHFDGLSGEFVENSEVTEIHGAKGALVYSRQMGQMEFFADSGAGEPQTETFVMEANRGGYRKNMIHMAMLLHDAFADAIAGEAEVPVSGEEGYRALQIIVAGDRSAELGQAVRILDDQ